MRQTGDVSSAATATQFTKPTSRTHRILESLRNIGLSGRKVDFLYDSTSVYVSSFKLIST